MSSIAESRDSLCSEGCEATFWPLIEDVSHVGDSGQYGHCDIIISRVLLRRLTELIINICVKCVAQMIKVSSARVLSSG